MVNFHDAWAVLFAARSGDCETVKIDVKTIYTEQINTIKFTSERSTTSIPFLDVNIQLETNESERVSTVYK